MREVQSNDLIEDENKVADIENEDQLYEMENNDRGLTNNKLLKIILMRFT